MDTTVWTGENVSVVTLAGRLDAAAAAELEERCAELAGDGPRRLLLDLGALSFVGSAGLRVVLLLGKRLARGGGALALCALGGGVAREVLVVSSLDTVFPVFSSVEEALRLPWTV